MSVTDPPTGIRFAMPSKPKESTSSQPTGSGQPVQIRTYSTSTATSDRAGESLSVFPIRVTDLDAYAARYVDTLVAQFRSAGATEPVVSGRHDLTVDHRAAVTLQFTFTAKDGTKPLWLISFVSTTRALLILQFFDSSSAASSSPVRTDQARVLASMQIP